MDIGDIAIGEVAEAQQRALMRLHVFFTGETHRLVNGYLEGLRARLLEGADEDGNVGAEGFLAVMSQAGTAWRETFAAWRGMLEAARREAAEIAFGGLARRHQYFMSLWESGNQGIRESGNQGIREFGEQGPEAVRIGVQGVPFYEGQLQEILDGAAERVYSDGFRLSQRIWRLDQESLGGIQRTLQGGLAEGKSAWKMAKELEAELGAGADCPRWTSTRLYRLSKADIAAGDKRGLIRGNPCESKGVAYNALRLARNEIQIVHHMATDAIFGRQPWIEREQVVLSPDHPDIGCECEDIVVGGENGDGVYLKGEITLPIHVQCLCYKVAVLMDEGAFVERMQGWMGGDMPWPEMDLYAAGLLGVGKADATDPGLLLHLAGTMERWLWGDEDALRDGLGGA